MRIIKSAAQLNVLIQVHINHLQTTGYVWHTPVYRVDDGADGSNWNVSVNCHDADAGPVISHELDLLRSAYQIPENDPTAIERPTEQRHEPT